MYKRYAGMLLMISVMLGLATVCVKEQVLAEVASDDVMNINVECNNEIIEGNQPHFTIQSVERSRIVLSEEDKMILYKIVEAEAGGEDRIGKILVANVILNRLEDDSFPDTVAGVVFQQEDGVAQFSPIANGKYESAVPKEETKEAVEAAIGGEDYSEGALYFMARKYADEENVKWFDTCLDKVLVHGGHEFYR